MKNPNNYDIRICCESIARGNAREIAYAKTLLKNVFEGDAKAFQKYFSFPDNAPALKIILE